MGTEALARRVTPMRCGCPRTNEMAWVQTFAVLASCIVSQMLGDQFHENQQSVKSGTFNDVCHSFTFSKFATSNEPVRKGTCDDGFLRRDELRKRRDSTRVVSYIRDHGRPPVSCASYWGGEDCVFFSFCFV